MFFYVKYKKIEVFCIFFEKNFVVSQILFTFAPEMPAHVRVGTLKTYIDGTRPPAICTASLEGRFRTLLSVCSNLATLNLSAAVMQQRASTWVDFISPCGHQSLYIYIIRCTPHEGARCLRI
jgi:hypothetical protein